MANLRIALFAMFLVLTLLNPTTALINKLVPPLPSGELDAKVDRTSTWSRKIEGRGGRYSGAHHLWYHYGLQTWISITQPIVDALVARASMVFTDILTRHLSSKLSCSRLEPCMAAASAEAHGPVATRLLPGLNHAVVAACEDTEQRVAIPTRSTPIS